MNFSFTVLRLFVTMRRVVSVYPPSAVVTVISVPPEAIGVIVPDLSMVATAVSEDCHETVLFVASEGVMV